MINGIIFSIWSIGLPIITITWHDLLNSQFGWFLRVTLYYQSVVWRAIISSKLFRSFGVKLLQRKEEVLKYLSEESGTENLEKNFLKTKEELRNIFKRNCYLNAKFSIDFVVLSVSVMNKFVNVNLSHVLIALILKHLEHADTVAKC